jgi:AcrR family transcriptional regulator
LDQTWFARLCPLDRALPKGPHQLSRDEVAQSQRGRLTYAITALVDEKGYAGTTVADVLRAAGVSRKAFYEHFRDKSECFLAAYDVACDFLAERTTAAASEAAVPDDPRAALWGAILGHLDCLAAEPTLSKVFFIEIFSAGREALERRARGHRRFADIARDWHAQARRLRPDYPAVPDSAYLAAVAATGELVTEHIRAGKVAELPELEPLVRDVYRSLLRIPPEG